MVMIIHRTKRDVERCRRKYGEAWKRYEEQVPYLFIPVSDKSKSSALPIITDENHSTSFEKATELCS